jgi:hypothetical protein
VVVVDQIESSLEDVNHVLNRPHNRSRVQPSGLVVCLSEVILFRAKGGRGETSVRNGPARRATEIDGPTDLVGTEYDGGTMIALVECVLAECLNGSLVEVRIHVEISLEQNIGSQLEPDVVAVQDEDQIIFFAYRFQSLHVGEQGLDFGKMLLVRVGFFMCAPVDQDRGGVIEDGGGEEQLAEVSVATCRWDEVVETGLAIAA